MKPSDDSTSQKIYRLFEKKQVQIIVILVLFILGAIMRIIAVFSTDIEPVDALGYINFARAFLTMDPSKITSAREPAFSIVLAFVFLFFPPDYTISRITTALIGSFCIPLTFLTSNSLRRRLIEEGIEVNIFVSYISSLFVTMNHYLIISDGRGLREPFTAFVLLLLLKSIFDYQVKPTRRGIATIAFLSILAFSIKFELLLIVGFLIFLLIFYDFSYLGNLKANWKRYFLAVSLIFVVFIFENAWLSSLYNGFISDIRASLYFEKEFGFYQPVTLIQYLFDYHTLTNLFSSWFHGVHESLELFRWIFEIFGFCLILVGLVYLFSKNSFEIPAIIFISIASQAFFIHIWGWTILWRFFLPYAPLATICIGYALVMVVKSIEIQVSPDKSVILSKTLFIFTIIGYLAFSYISEVIRFMEML